MIQKVIRAALRATTHEVHVAPDGALGLELIRRELPDVVFTDVAMPVLDGYALARALKDDPATRDIPVVFMTASVQGGQADRAAAQGVAGVLAKPFTLADLRTRVDGFSARER